MNAPLRQEPLEIVVKSDPDKPVAFACAACGVMFSCLIFGGHESGATTAKQAAEGHCGPKFCDCGKIIERRHWLKCDDCLEAKEVEKDAKAFEKAKKVSIEEYDGKYAVFWPKGPGGGMGDGFYTNLDELLEVYEDEQLDLPPYVWGAKPFDVRADARDILERVIEGHHEDAWDELSDGAETELQKLLDAFFEKQNIRSWEVDYTTVVLLRSDD